MDFNERQNIYKNIKGYAYYIIIGILSFISVVFLPFLGSVLEGDFEFPDTVGGWIIWVFTKLAVAAINILMYFSFIKQANINIKDNPEYKLAKEKLNALNRENTLKARSPLKYFTGVWSSKGVMLFVTTFLSAWVFGEAILRFDLETLLSYTFTVLMGIIFGYIQMNQTEDYWISEFPAYVDELEKKLKGEQNDNR